MVYGILRLINFAHGDVFMVAGLHDGLHVRVACRCTCRIPLMLMLTVLLGFVIERAAYKPLRSAPRMSVMISAIGVSYLLQNTGDLRHRRPAHDVSARIGILYETVDDCRHLHEAGHGHHHPCSGAGAGACC